MPDEKEVAVIGLGPSGVTAAIYLNRFGMVPYCFEKELVGGQVNKTEKIENYTGVKSIGGPELGNLLESQLSSFGIKPIYKEVKEVRLNDSGAFTIKYGNEEKEFKYVIVCSGLRPNPFVVPNQESYNSKGISRCAICDGPLYKGKDVVVVGAGNSAFEEASYLATICSSVSLIARRKEFRAFPSAIESLKNKPNAKIFAPYNIVNSNGSNSVEEVVIQNVETKEEETIKASAIFLYVGEKADSTFMNIKKLNVDDNGYIIVNDKKESSVENLFACGDVIKKDLRQVATAVSDGSIAAYSIYQKYSLNHE